MMQKPCRVATLALLLCTLCLSPFADAQNKVTPEQLSQRIQEMAAEIRNAQAADGSLGGHAQYPLGCTSLGIIALRAAGAPAADPVVRRAAAYVASKMTANKIDGLSHGVYEISLAMMALQNVDAKRYRAELFRGASYLVKAQAPNGGWNYGPSNGRADNSNSQYAMLGLHSAMMAGIKINEKVWKSAWGYWRDGQQADGGWNYTLSPAKSYGSMTCAGIASMYLCNMWLHVLSGRCGYYYDDTRIWNGLRWLGKHFSVRTNPGRGGGYYWYFIYALERSGVILARRNFGVHDWYRLGVEHVLSPAAPDANAFYDKCFRLMFLAKGNAPLLVHKAQYTTKAGHAWQMHIFDIKFLILFAENRLDRFLDWQLVQLASPLKELLRAPLLYVSGFGNMNWSELEMNRFRDYISAGGFALVEAARADTDWNRDFTNYIVQYFPEDSLVELAADHPIFTTPHFIPVRDRPRLLALTGPCWISMIYAPNGISCRWDIADFDHSDFLLGMNILNYAIGEEELKGKLEEVEYQLPSLQERARRRGAFTVGQLVHDRDWKPHKLAWNTVLTTVNDRAGIEVYNQTIPIDIGKNTPFEGQMLYITGSREFDFTHEQKEAMKTFIERGGFIFAEAACSSPEFDATFREMLEELLPDNKLQEMPAGHALFQLGEEMGQMHITEALKRLHPTLNRPPLEHVEIDGRSVIVYTKYDISSAIEGHPCNTCPSILEPSASRLAVKIVLYGLAS